MHPKDINIKDFTYHLPEERIAAFPLAQRDASKLLLYKNGTITEDIYHNIADHIPANSLLVFNNTRVIQARILFQKASGGVIEIFCLEPYEDVNEYNIVMSRRRQVRWKCMIGGASKWKEGSLEKTTVYNNSSITLKARLTEKLPDAYVVELSWEPAEYTFAEVLSLFGNMPLPPYIKRKAEDTDKDRYQTIYAKHEGSVAAPTAGLHFTEHIFESLAAKNIGHSYVTLHVGAGTFKPVKAEVLSGHEMHSEWIDVDRATIQSLIDHQHPTIIAVGTTSLRTIESIYWMGVKTKLNPAITANELPLQQWDVYESPLNSTAFSLQEASEALLQWMEQHNLQRIFTHTQILIAPGYRYRVANAIVTNFHQPQSTLLLLVAAATGSDWERIYNYALQHDFRFLSYGDGSLLYVNKI